MKVMNKPDYKNEVEYFNSKEFIEVFTKIVDENTWGKGIPKIYMNDNGDIVEHWKNGTINILHTKEELNKKL